MEYTFKLVGGNKNKSKEDFEDTIKVDINMTGEGIVWFPVDEGWCTTRFAFKTKGEEHKGTKTKEKVPIDIEKVNSIKELVDTVVSEARLLQGLDYLRQENLTVEHKNIETYLKWVYNDVIKEELDTIVENGFEPKDISATISTKARLWLIDKINKLSGL
jgi:hypothetical protein